jgi:organic hydroperoxide reductase OsmC/OhrA
MTTFLAIAEASKLDFISFDCRSTGTLGESAGKLVMTEIKLEPVVRVPNPADIARAMKILKKAEENCLISQSVTARIVMNPKVELAAAEEASTTA